MKPVQIGDEVGGYRVIDMAGSGGMGTVYKIEHIITKRIEAMKLLPPAARDDPEQVQRFEREIQVQARLHHPNIVELFNAVRTGNCTALVMEYVEGESLQRMLEAGALPVASAVDFTSQVLSALTYAHEAGVIHRDVGPSNIIVTADGTAKLTDFGLARTATDVRLTTSGIPLGSPWYMSPEQVRGIDETDARTDLYAMGAVLYEMLTGAKLFEASGAFAVMRAQVEAEPVAPSQRNRNVPKALDGVVRKALAKDPAMRYQSADEFRVALRDAAAVAPPVAAMRAIKPPIAARAAAVAAMAPPVAVTAPSVGTMAPPAAVVAPPPVSAMARARAEWSAAIGELALRMRGYRPSQTALLATVVVSGLLAGVYMVRFFPSARAQATPGTSRAAAYVAPPVVPATAPPVETTVAPPVVPVVTPPAPASAATPSAPPVVPAAPVVVARVRPRSRYPARAMGPVYRPPLRVTGGEPEAGAAKASPNTHVRHLAEAPEPTGPPIDIEAGRKASAVAIGVDPETPAAPPSVAPEKQQNGNRLVKAIGGIFRKRPKPAEKEPGKALKKD